jgi:enoyl-CoA hydratase
MSDTPNQTVHAEVDGSVLILRLDDGKVNVISHAVLQALHAQLDAVEDDRDIKAVVIAGRPGLFSGGFDLKEFATGPEATRDLVIAGAELCNRLYVYPKVTVTAVTGNAVAAGAILTMACDWNVGADGPFRMGLPETAIGMALPVFANELARARVHPSYVGRATILGEMFDPAGALAAGYLDEVVPPADTIPTAIAKAHALSALNAPAVRHTKRAVRQAVHDHIAATLVADVTSMTTGTA